MSQRKHFSVILTVAGFAFPVLFWLCRWLLFLSEGYGPSVAGRGLGFLGMAGMYISGPAGALAVLSFALLNRKKQNMFDRLGILFLFLINLSLPFFIPANTFAERSKSKVSGYPPTLTFARRSRDSEKSCYHLTEQDWINIESSQGPVILNFDYCGITEDELSRLAGNRHIQQIRICNCPKITDRVVQPLSRIPELKGITLVKCPQLWNPDFSALSSLKHLSFLNLTGCVNLSEKSLGSVAGLPRLKELFLSGCLNANESVHSNISRLRRLRLLDLTECRNITDDAVVKLLPMKHLRVLSLRGCVQITGEGVKPLRKLPIKAIQFPEHFYAEDQIDAIAGFSKLTVLSLAKASVCHNREIHCIIGIPFDERNRCLMITDEALKKLGKMKSLRRLCYPGDRQSEAVKELQKKLPKCRITG